MAKVLNLNNANMNKRKFYTTSMEHMKTNLNMLNMYLTKFEESKASGNRSLLLVACMENMTNINQQFELIDVMYPNNQRTKEYFNKIDKPNLIQILTHRANENNQLNYMTNKFYNPVIEIRNNMLQDNKF